MFLQERTYTIHTIFQIFTNKTINNNNKIQIPMNKLQFQNFQNFLIHNLIAIFNQYEIY